MPLTLTMIYFARAQTDRRTESLHITTSTIKRTNYLISAFCSFESKLSDWTFKYIMKTKKVPRLLRSNLKTKPEWNFVVNFYHCHHSLSTWSIKTIYAWAWLFDSFSDYPNIIVTFEGKTKEKKNVSEWQIVLF